MSLNNNFGTYSKDPIVLKGLGNISSPTVNPSQNYSNNQIGSDKVKLNGLNLTNQKQVQTFNIFGNSKSVDKVISQINEIQDPATRSSYFRDFMVELLDNDDFVSAAKVINETPVVIYKNSMFKSFIQELIVNGKYDSALNLINKYPDARIQNELKGFMANYINYYDMDSTVASKVLGDESISNFISLKADGLMTQAGNFFSGVGNSITSLWSSPSKGNNIASNANDIIGKQYRYSYLDNGNLACAYAVSQALKGVPGLEGVSSAECNTLANMLSKKGFVKAYSNGYKSITGRVDYKAGDVVFFNRSGKQGYGHVGVVAEVVNGVPYMVHNSSSKRQVVKVRLDQYYKTPVAVFRSPT